MVRSPFRPLNPSSKFTTEVELFHQLFQDITDDIVAPVYGVPGCDIDHAMGLGRGGQRLLTAMLDPVHPFDSPLTGSVAAPAWNGVLVNKLRTEVHGVARAYPAGVASDFPVQLLQFAERLDLATADQIAPAAFMFPKPATTSQQDLAVNSGAYPFSQLIVPAYLLTISPAVTVSSAPATVTAMDLTALGKATGDISVNQVTGARPSMYVTAHYRDVYNRTYVNAYSLKAGPTPGAPTSFLLMPVIAAVAGASPVAGWNFPSNDVNWNPTAIRIQVTDPVQNEFKKTSIKFYFCYHDESARANFEQPIHVSVRALTFSDLARQYAAWRSKKEATPCAVCQCAGSGAPSGGETTASTGSSTRSRASYSNLGVISAPAKTGSTS